MFIGVVGNYGNENQGDEAILEGMIVQLLTSFPVNKSDIMVFSNNPAQTREKFGVQSTPLYIKKKTAPGSLMATIARNRKTIRQLDFLLIGGGGILMDQYINGLVIFGMYGWLAKLTRTPAVVYGAGAGPIRTRKGKQILKSLGNIAQFVTVRDEASRILLTSIGVKKPIHVIADPAHHVPVPAAIEQGEDKLKIGVTAVPYFHANYWPEEDTTKYNDYIRGMAANLDRLLDLYTHAHVTFFATKHPQDMEVSRDIQAMMQHTDKTEVYGDALDHREIIVLIQKQDMVIGTRLHSLILALAAHTPVMAISYHSKVENFMDMMDAADRCIQITDIHKEDDSISTIFAAMKENWENVHKETVDAAESMKHQQPQGMDLIKQALPSLVEGTPPE